MQPAVKPWGLPYRPENNTSEGTKLQVIFVLHRWDMFPECFKRNNFLRYGISLNSYIRQMDETMSILILEMFLILILI